MAKFRTQTNKNDSVITFWTPGFIIRFTLMVITGLSAASILTEAWINNRYQSSLILSGFTIVIIISLTVLTRYTSSLWIHLGTLFGYLWTIFSLVTFFLPTSGPISLIRVQLLAAASSTLLGFSICLSTHRTHIRRWDTLLFWLAPPIGACILVIYVLLHPVHNGHIRGLIDTTTTVLLAFASGIWWLRPSCWQRQVCPTFLFGLAPLITIFVTYWVGDALGTRLFLSQLALLCILLGITYVIQAEHTKHIRLSRIAESAIQFPFDELASDAPHYQQNKDRTNSIVEQMEQHARPE